MAWGRCTECSALQALLPGEPMCGKHVAELQDELKEVTDKYLESRGEVSDMYERWETHQEACHVDAKGNILTNIGDDE